MINSLLYSLNVHKCIAIILSYYESLKLYIPDGTFPPAVFISCADSCPAGMLIILIVEIFDSHALT